MICDYPDTDILKVSFWSFLSCTKNWANFNLPTLYGHTTIHEKLWASGRREGGGEATPWQGLCPWILLTSPPLSPSYRIYGWMTLTKMWVPICLYCSNCTKFGQLILRKIIKIVATTRCQILRQKCTKFNFGSPRPPSWIWGPTSKGRGGEGKRREGKER